MNVNVSSQALPHSVSTQTSFSWLRIVRYLGVSLLANGLVWGSGFHYLKTTPPIYSSEFTLGIAGTGTGVNLNLPDIGQASSSTASAFGAIRSDPRENYKLILTGDAVLSDAAEQLGLSQPEFGKPKVEIVNNTTVFHIGVSGTKPVEVQKKAATLIVSFNARLDELRKKEQSARDQITQDLLSEAQSKLSEAQLKLSDYKSKSPLKSSDQVTQLINNVENLRQQRAQFIGQEQDARQRLQQLSSSIGLSPKDAAEILALQTDQLFLKSLTEYAEATIELENLLPRRGPKYPDVVATRQRQQASLELMLERGQALLNRPVDLATLEQLSLDNGNGSGIKRTELIQTLVLLESEQQGAAGQISALTEQIAEFENRLNSLSDKEFTLNSLIRDAQIAEAVFAATLAKLDLGNGDPFGAYPLVQVIEEPNLPHKPIAPKKTVVLAGMLLGSILITTGLTMIWWRLLLIKLLAKFTQKLLA
ncbi:MAG: hypothetical protein AAGE59_00100 [Cyanobacteria bacterium P01_F01_bin.86]